MRFFVLAAALGLCLLATSAPAGIFSKMYGMKGPPEANGTPCDGGIAAPAAGIYGANGPYGMQTQTIKNDLATSKDVTVFFPTGGDAAPRPVIFFSHAYGATDWKVAYAQFVPHIVSLGYIVVYAPYPTLGDTIDGRYNVIWHGFELAVAKFGNSMDLTRVGFVGHSFGGGTVPAMAYKGIIGRGWGSAGAFAYALAPWYSYQITNADMQQFPKQVTLLWQIYGADTANDHRMAIDMYNAAQGGAAKTIFQYVQSQTIGTCTMQATHSTPGRNIALRLKQYSVFREFDALADYSFNGSKEGLAEITNPDKDAPMQATRVAETPEATRPQSEFMFPWDNSRNPRR
ncbi:MAG: hypothetical protein PW788_13260 [Micavibrio sp.]|nr:hypothetical protein [Micavibrio sp.]